MTTDTQKSMGITTVGDSGVAKVKNPAGPLKLATAAVNSANPKVGKALNTYAAQISCPNGTNSSYRCPLYGDGCYAEGGPAGWTTSRLNKAGGMTSYHDPHASVTAEQVAEDEAAALASVHKEWTRKRVNPFVRLHVVGDAVTRKAVQILNEALGQFIVAVSGGAKNIWNYTHGWRDIPRSAWRSDISVLASCDTEDDMPKAHSAGYACAIVLPRYVQAEGKKLGAAYKLDNGFTIIPCPYEVGRVVRGKQLQCVDCKLCMKDDFLRKNKAAIGFAAHGAKAEKITKRLVGIQPGKE